MQHFGIKALLKNILPHKDKAARMLNDYLDTLPLDKSKGEFRNAVLLTPIGIEGGEGVDLQFGVVALAHVNEKLMISTTHDVYNLSDLSGVMDNLDEIMKAAESYQAANPPAETPAAAPVVDPITEEPMIEQAAADPEPNETEPAPEGAQQDPEPTGEEKQAGKPGEATNETDDSSESEEENQE